MGILKMDFKRAFCSWKFPTIVIMIAIMWYLNSRRFMLDEDVLAIFFDTTGRSTIINIALILCNSIFGLSVCEELQDNGLRPILGRIGITKYTCSKLVVCMCSNVFAYCLGTFLYLTYELTKHPLVLEGGYALQDIQRITTFSWLLPEHTLFFIFLQCLVHGILSSCMSVCAIALSPYIRDGFIILCIPLLLFYMLLFISEKILALPEDVESMFWVITAAAPEKIFFFRIILFTFLVYAISGVVLSRGIRRRKCYA